MNFSSQEDYVIKVVDSFIQEEGYLIQVDNNFIQVVGYFMQAVMYRFRMKPIHESLSYDSFHLMSKWPEGNSTIMYSHPAHGSTH